MPKVKDPTDDFFVDEVVKACKALNLNDDAIRMSVEYEFTPDNKVHIIVAAEIVGGFESTASTIVPAPYRDELAVVRSAVNHYVVYCALRVLSDRMDKIQASITKARKK